MAKLIAQNPEIILLDEPTNHLDLPYQIELINFLKKWGKENKKTIIGVLHDINLAIKKTIIGVLHDINLAINLANNILAIENGEIKYYGNNRDFLFSNKINEIYKIDIKKYMIENFKKWNNT